MKALPEEFVSMQIQAIKDKLKRKFIVLDGPDGCGKTVQCRSLADWLSQQHVDVRGFRDPGTTAIGEQIRSILLDHQHEEMDTRTELLLYMAARAQLWAQSINPALENSQCVLLDRWLSSTCAYQGFAGGFGIRKVIKIAKESLQRTWPDLTIILDVDAQTASARLQRKLDRMELKGPQYHKKVRQGFLELAKTLPGFAVVNASAEEKTVQTEIRKVLTNTDF